MSEQDSRALATQAVSLFMSTDTAKALTSESSSDQKPNEFDHLFSQFFLEPDYTVSGLSKLIRLLTRHNANYEDSDSEVEPTVDLDDEARQTAYSQSIMARLNSMSKSDVMRIYSQKAVLAEYQGRDLVILKRALVDWSTRNDVTALAEWL